MEAPAELFLISAMVRSGNVLEPSQQGITPSHFHSYKVEYEWILDFNARYGHAPSKAVFRKTFPDFTVLASDDLAYAIDEVKRNHAKLSVTRMLKGATEFLRTGESYEAVAYLNSGLRDLNRDIISGAKAFDAIGQWSELFSDVAERVEKVRDGGITGIPTGWPTLDERTNGAQNGDLWIVAARLGHGKTWGLCKMAEAALVAGKKVLMVSLEMTYLQISYRIHTILGKRFGYSIRNSALTSGIGVDLHEYRSFLADLPSHLPDSAQLTIIDAGRGRVSPVTISGLIEEYEPDVVYIDYITLMATSEGRQATEDWRMAASISADMKMVAMQYGIPVIAAAQVNREGDGAKPPKVSKLAQTDSLGQDASVVVTMAKPGKTIANWELGKNRHGVSGIQFWSLFNPDVGDFTELTFEQAQHAIRDEFLEEDEDR